MPSNSLVLWAGQIALTTQSNQVAAFASFLNNWITQNFSTKSNSVRNSVAAQVILEGDSIVEVYGMRHYDRGISEAPACSSGLYYYMTKFGDKAYKT